jgi:hypothetical protein
VKKLMAVVLMGASWMLGGPTASAQNPPPQESTTHVIKDQDLKLLRQDLRSKRKQLIAANLKLTDTEAPKFWSVYDQYVTELIAINDKKFGLIQEYADSWGKLTNDQSLLFTRKLVGHGHRDSTVAAEVCADGCQGLGWKEDSNFFPIRPTHCDDDGSAGVIADAPGAGAGEQ